MSGPNTPACPGAPELGFEPEIRIGVCRFALGPFCVSVHVTLPVAIPIVSLVVPVDDVDQLGAEMLVIAALPTATIVQTSAPEPSGVVPPTVVDQVGTEPAEVPAVVQR